MLPNRATQHIYLHHSVWQKLLWWCWVTLRYGWLTREPFVYLKSWQFFFLYWILSTFYETFLMSIKVLVHINKILSTNNSPNSCFGCSPCQSQGIVHIFWKTKETRQILLTFIPPWWTCSSCSSPKNIILGIQLNTEHFW